MSARILDGKRIAQELLERVRVAVDSRIAQGLASPGLAVVLVGDDAASSVYVRNKRKA
ncbi:MAG: bifunctional methylenetetrahydrofolate dehydrogenase/methenyltetrahydrofolate cyclohydrolase, partial [Microbacterium sp.]|nr:bifunctional methylenetetrahydrofolate dehydrogenase/methenyltetrahydrofolate cyclohydrolase [Microbacterium sp.]